MTPHATRARYQSGCRCAPCLEANREYQRTRKTESAPRLVSTARVRAHILALSRTGVGRKAIANACDLAESTVWRIRNGSFNVIRASTAKRILAVDANARADRSRVAADKTLDLIGRLVADGYSRRFLARQIGYRARVPSLPFLYNRRSDAIAARTASRVERLYVRIQQGRVAR
jgi:hypothetical protein